MEFRRGQIVRSTAGHDKGDLFFVLDTEGDFLLLADGKHRMISDPKRKRRKHAASVGTWTHPIAGKLQAGEPVSDSELRRALGAARSRLRETEEV